MKDNVKLLAGVERPAPEPWAPFDPLALEFLSALSAAVRRLPGRREELAAFGFWCRRSHLEALRERHSCPGARLGRGLIFHIAPSNVPFMFAYSYAIGLLAGNANVVRLSSRRSQAEEELCALMQRVMEEERFTGIRERSSFVAYDRDDAVTGAYLAECDGRVVWGGDATVEAIRRLPMPAHAVELCFPDRWSFAVLEPQYLSGLDAGALGDLARRFYNDTYLMDQNACSSPQMAAWLGEADPELRRRWWEAVACEAEARYGLGPYQAARKYELFCRQAMTAENGGGQLERFGGNLVYVARLPSLSADAVKLKGGFGLFYEAVAETPEALLPLLTPAVQTVTWAGSSGDRFIELLRQRHAAGVSRVVPVGQALELDTIWDGHDLIAELSRRIV